MAKRTGRGRLSGIELLPEEATPIIAWAADELRDRSRTQLDIYQEFHAKLEDLQREHRGELEFTIPSFKAFNRHAIKLATLSRRLDETREIAGALAKSFDAGASDNLTVIAAEAIKTLVFEVLTAAGESGIDPKGAMQLAGALYRATQAQGVSTARRLKVEQEFEQKAEAAIEKVAAEAGLSAERIAQLRRDFLGVRPKKKDGSE